MDKANELYSSAVDEDEMKKVPLWLARHLTYLAIFLLEIELESQQTKIWINYFNCTQQWDTTRSR